MKRYCLDSKEAIGYFLESVLEFRDFVEVNLDVGASCYFVDFASYIGDIRDRVDEFAFEIEQLLYFVDSAIGAS